MYQKPLRTAFHHYFGIDQRKIMEELRKDGYVEANDTPTPLEAVQNYKFYDNRFVKSAHWSITGKCNCKCQHCYMSAPQNKVEEFTHAQILDIIAQMEACGVQKVQLTGGEALIRKDFWEIVNALAAADIPHVYLANGLSRRIFGKSQPLYQLKNFFASSLR